MLCLCIGLKVRLPDQSFNNSKKKAQVSELHSICRLTLFVT